MRLSTPVLLGICVAVTAGCNHFKGNIQEVECGRLYRSAQLEDDQLEATIRRFGIRTVLNLRGEAEDEGWWCEEKAVCQRLGVAHHDEHWSAMRPPDPDSLVRIPLEGRPGISLNLSTAVGIALYEVERQRRLPGGPSGG